MAGALALLSGPPGLAGSVTPPTPAPREARALSQAFSSAARAIGPAVVRIEAPAAGGDLDPTTASGLIIDTAGNIVTARQVVERASAVRVILADGRELPASVLGTDALCGIAVVRLARPPADLDAARFGDSDLVEVGEWTLAISRPLGLDETVSAGIIEGRLRPPPVSVVSAPRGRGYLQTDADVDGGADGGPLVNLDGEVIGLFARGVAVPIDQVRRAAQMIVSDGRAHYPYIGVGLLDVEGLDGDRREGLGPRRPARGALVNHIWRGAPAERAGLRAGDIITTIDNQETPAVEDVVDRIAFHAVGETLTVGFVRNGTARSARVSLDDLPAPQGRERPARKLDLRPAINLQ